MTPLSLHVVTFIRSIVGFIRWLDLFWQQWDVYLTVPRRARRGTVVYLDRRTRWPGLYKRYTIYTIEKKSYFNYTAVVMRRHDDDGLLHFTGEAVEAELLGAELTQLLKSIDVQFEGRPKELRTGHPAGRDEEMFHFLSFDASTKTRYAHWIEFLQCASENNRELATNLQELLERYRSICERRMQNGNEREAGNDSKEQDELRCDDEKKRG